MDAVESNTVLGGDGDPCGGDGVPGVDVVPYTTTRSPRYTEERTRVALEALVRKMISKQKIRVVIIRTLVHDCDQQVEDAPWVAKNSTLEKAVGRRVIQLNKLDGTSEAKGEIANLQAKLDMLREKLGMTAKDLETLLAAK